MSNKLREAAQQALEALENFARFQRMMMDGPDASDKLLAEDYAEAAFLQGAQAIPAIRAALAESERDWSLLEATQESLREHMAEIQRLRQALEFTARHKNSDWPERCQQMVDTARTAPQPAKQPLTDEEIDVLWRSVPNQALYEAVKDFARAIERAHGITSEANGETND